jgi:RNase H-like domain found in reverse transcriptase
MEGRRPHHGIITKVQNWLCLMNVTQVCGFLGTVGVAQNWIWQFAKIVKPLTLLTKKSPHEFKWNNQAEEAMNQLKEASINLPVSKSLNIDIANVLKEDEQTSDYGLVTLAVDSSIIAVGWIEYQTLEDGCHPIVFGSVTNNEAKSRYSQPQIELKGLFKALKAQRNDLWGIHFKVEVDAKFLKQTINTPGLLNAAMSQWISYIQLFDFELTHVPATKHQGPDGLSRCPADENHSAISEEELELEKPGHFITGPRSLEEYEDWTQLHPLASRLRISRIKREAYEDAVEFRQNSTVFFLKPQENSIRSGGFVTLSHKVHFSRNSKTPSQHSEISSESSSEIKEHPHKIKDSDGKDYWEKIENYLEHLKIPLGIKNTRSFIQTTKHYFSYQGTLWRRPKNGQLPQKVIKNPDD